jgi:hypothetical protein
MGERPQNALVAAKWLNIPTGMISVAQPDEAGCESHGQLESGSAVMYRGRAAVNLSGRASGQPWDSFAACLHEDLREPGRIHLDPLGNLHICQGIAIGNLFEKPLKQICQEYDGDAHPVCGPLLSGGPAALVNEYNLPHASHYADACQLCYDARLSLRARLPECIRPDQMYGVNL